MPCLRLAGAGGTRTVRLFALIPLAFGIGLSLLCYSTLSASLRQLDRYERSFGVVEGYEVDYSEDEEVYRPEVRFVTPEGETIRFTGELAGGKSYEIGEEIAVIYDPDRPRQVRIDSFGELFFVPLVSGILGLAGLGWALLLFLSNGGRER